MLNNLPLSDINNWTENIYGDYVFKYNKFMTGKNAKSLENEIIALFEDNKFIKSSIDKNKKVGE